MTLSEQLAIIQQQTRKQKLRNIYKMVISYKEDLISLIEKVHIDSLLNFNTYKLQFSIDSYLECTDKSKTTKCIRMNSWDGSNVCIKFCPYSNTILFATYSNGGIEEYTYCGNDINEYTLRCICEDKYIHKIDKFLDLLPLWIATINYKN